MITIYKNAYWCRWCGRTYNPHTPGPRDGFCCTAHKQAHHRAYIKYVTTKHADPPRSRKGRNAIKLNP